jgi:hypothetical protein
VPRHVAWLVVWVVVDNFAYAARPGASARRAACRAARRAAHHLLLRLRRASRCLDTSCGSSCGSSSTTSPTPCVRVPRHVARLVCAAHRRQLRLHRASRCLGSSSGSSSTTSPTLRVRVPQHAAWLVLDYASRRLVVDYFAYVARPGASARRAARCAARRRLLRLCRASGCLDTSCGLSSTTSPRAGFVIDYFAYAARPGASARRAARRGPRAVSPLDFSSVGCTDSCRAPDRSVSRLDYSVRRHSTCCPVALDLLQPRRHDY